MNTEKITMSELVISTIVSYNKIKNISITSNEGEHGSLILELEVADSFNNSEAERLSDTPVSVSTKDGNYIFAGVCTDISVQQYAEYKTIIIHAKTMSIKMDRDRKNKTFQNPSKTFSEVINEVSNSYGALVQLQKDFPIAIILYQQNETDWEFIKRIAAQWEQSVFIDVTSSEIRIQIGTSKFSNFDENIIIGSLSDSKDIGELSKNIAKSDDGVSSYTAKSEILESSNLLAAAGGRIGNRTIVSHTIINNRQLIENNINCKYSDAIKPSCDAISEPTFCSGVLTGTVLAVNKNLIQVQYNTDGENGGNTTWIPYESSMSNSFYCMPDIGDKVFVYYENNGKVACLGSKHADLSSPDFDKPEEKVLTNYDKMIKFKEASLHITSTRKLHDQESEDAIHITMDDKAGITINSGREIKIESENDLRLSASSIPPEEELAKKSKKTVEERTKEGYEEYKASGGQSIVEQTFAATSLGVKQFGSDVYESFANSLKQMTFYDIWSGKENNNKAADDVKEQFETGVLNLFGLNQIKIEVGDSIIEMTNDINIVAKQFSWLGYKQEEHAKEELLLQDWWETILDGAQLLLDIAGFIPVIGTFCDLANGAISLARGDYAEAAISFVSSIPVLGDSVAAVKLGVKGIKAAKTVTEMTKATRIMKMVKAFYMGAKATASWYRNREELKELYNLVKSGQFNWSDCTHVNKLITLGKCLNFTVQAGKATYDVKKGVDVDYSGKNKKQNADSDAENSGSTKSNQEPKADSSKSEGTTAGDPINVVTGAMTIDVTDIIINDILGEFRFKRFYKSIYQNKNCLLGRAWTTNLDNWIFIKDDKAVVMCDNLHEEKFIKQDGIWINKRGNDSSYTLKETENEYLFSDTKERNVYEFDKSGKLISITDRNDNKIGLSYLSDKLKKVSFPSGQFMEFIYERGKVKKITDRLGWSVTYEYKGDLLTAVTYPNDGVITYDYDNQGYLREITDQNGNRVVTNEYDREGRVVRQKLDEKEYVILYNDADRRNTFVTANTDYRVVYEYNKDKLLTNTIYDDGTSTSVAYDNRENVIYEKDRLGNEIHRVYNEKSELIEEYMPNGLINKFTFDEAGNLITYENNNGKKSTYLYDERGNCLKEIKDIGGNIYL